MQYSNLADMFFKKKTECPNHIAYQYKKDGVWHSVTYAEAVTRAEQLAAGLLSLGLDAGDRVALIAHNRLEWALIDYATLSIGAVLVPIYPSLLSEQILYLLNDSGARIVIAEDDSQKAKIQWIANQLEHTKYFYLIEEGALDLSNWKPLEALEKTGISFLKVQPDVVMRRIPYTKRSDWATIIYTSGTTGEPKGAILSHDNLLSNIENAAQICEIFRSD